MPSRADCSFAQAAEGSHPINNPRSRWVWGMFAVLAFTSLSYTAATALTLEEAVQLAMTRNERSRAADMRIAAADARVDRAMTFFLPTLTLNGIYTRRANESFRIINQEKVFIQRFNAVAPNAAFTLSLFDASTRSLYRQIKQERNATRSSSTNDKRLLAFDAADAFLIALSAEQVRDAAERRLEFARRSLADARARFEAQLTSSNDVTKAELELATAEREGTRARGGVETAYLQLGYMINAKVEGPLQAPETLLEAAAAPPGETGNLIAESQKRRLDVAASRQHTEALRASATEPLMRYFPSLGLNGIYRATNEAGLNGHTTDWSAVLSLTWRLYDGGARNADRAERVALADAADLDMQAIERRVEVEVRTARVALENEQAAIKQAMVAADVARQNAEQTAELYRQNIASELAVADANVRLFEAEVALARERYGLAIAYLSVRAALGLDSLGKEPTL